MAHTNSEGTQKLGQHNEMGSRVFKNSSSLTHQAIKSEKKIGGALNPEWVEWLMGYPIGWTE